MSDEKLKKVKQSDVDFQTVELSETSYRMVMSEAVGNRVKGSFDLVSITKRKGRGGVDIRVKLLGGE